MSDVRQYRRKSMTGFFRRKDNMKKFLSVIMGIILTACLAACGSSNKGTVNNNEQATTSNQETI